MERQEVADQKKKQKRKLESDQLDTEKCSFGDIQREDQTPNVDLKRQRRDNPETTLSSDNSLNSGATRAPKLREEIDDNTQQHVLARLAAEKRQVKAAQHGIGDVKKADDMQKSSRKAEAEIGSQTFGASRAWKLREDIAKRTRLSHGASDALQGVIVPSAPLHPQSMTQFQNAPALTERRRRILRESKLLPHVSIARPIPVSCTLHHFVQRRFENQIGIHSMEVGGNGDCLFHSVAAGLEHLLLESTAASRHVLHRIPLTVCSSGKLAVVQHLRNMCAEQIETWSWEELLNYYVRASMDQNLGEWRDLWNPTALLRDHNFEILIGCDTVRAVSDNPNGDIGDIFVIIDKSDARVGGNTSQQLQTPIPQGRAFLIALRSALQDVFRTLGNTHWGDSTDARLLTDALDVGFFLFADLLQGNSTQCLVALDLSRADFPYFLALWWNNHSHFRSLEIKTSSDTPFRSCWPRFQAPQTLLDDYHAVNRANIQ